MSSNRHVAPKHVLLPEARGRGPGSEVVVDSDKLKHLRKVLRLEWGDRILVLDGAGRLLEATLEKAGERGVARLGRVQREVPRPLDLELVIALPKNATMDWVVEKAVECGATRVTPVVSSRSVVKPAEGDEAKYLRRWQHIMDGAVEQSEHLWRPVVSAPIGWSEYIAAARSEKSVSVAFVSELREQGASEEALLRDCVHSLQSGQGKGVRLAIGPEGGFADFERKDLELLGFVSTSLGASVLRVETAVVAALTLARVLRTVSRG